MYHIKKHENVVIIPAYNEEENILSVIQSICVCNFPVDIIVINDGSADKTAEVVSQAGYNVISHPFNMGYGAALQTGFKFAERLQYQYVIQFDGDGQHNPNDIERLLQKIKCEKMDIVIGSRFLTVEGNQMKKNLAKTIAVEIFRWLIFHIAKTKITDPTSGLQALSYKAFTYYAKMGRFVSDFPDADILVRMIRANYRVCEISTTIRDRVAGESMHSGLKPIYYMIKVLLSIFVVIAREKVLKEGGKHAHE